jgi:hypothetical protein
MIMPRRVTRLLSVAVLIVAALAAHTGDAAGVSAVAGPVSVSAGQFASLSSSVHVQGAQGTAQLLQGQQFGTNAFAVAERPGSTTADPSLAVTPTRFVLATNSDVSVHVISNGPDDGRVVGDVDLHTVFGGPAGDEVIQPHLVFDQTVRRFFMSAAEVDLDSSGTPTGSRVWLAYSADGVNWTPKPLTARSTSFVFDQPIIAADVDKIVVSFTARPLGGGSGGSGDIRVVQKSDLLRSGAVHQVRLSGPAIPAELAPAVTVTPSRTLWLIADEQTQVTLVALTGTPDAGSVTSASFQLAITPVVTPPAPIQPFGKSVPIPPPRFVTAMWRAGTLWTTTVDGCTPPGSTTQRSCLRLVAFHAPDPPAAPTVTHDFDIGDATMDYFAPAVATDGYRNVVVAASESNAYTDPTVALFGERPPFTAVTALTEGVQQQYVEYNGLDWGGYSAVAIDPSDPASVWTDAQDTPRQGGDAAEPDWQTVGIHVLASTPKSRRGDTPAFGTRYNESAVLVYRRPDGRLEWLSSPGPCPNCWNHAEAFTAGPGATSAPALDPNIASGFEGLFTRRRDHHIWYYDSLQAGTWYDLGGHATSAPTALPPDSAGHCQLSVFIRGADGAVHRKVHDRFDAGWRPWRSLGGAVGTGTQPGAVNYGNSKVAVFTRGADNRVHWKHSLDCGAHWTRWSSLGGHTYSNPAASSQRTGNIDVFIRGTNNALYVQHLNRGSWTGWTNLGGSLQSGPAAAIPQVETTFPNSVPWGTEVIAVGPDQHLWSDLRPAGGSWTGWHQLYWEGPGWNN